MTICEFAYCWHQNSLFAFIAVFSFSALFYLFDSPDSSVIPIEGLSHRNRMGFMMHVTNALSGGAVNSPLGLDTS